MYRLLSVSTAVRDVPLSTQKGRHYKCFLLLRYFSFLQLEQKGPVVKELT